MRMLPLAVLLSVLATARAFAQDAAPDAPPRTPEPWPALEPFKESRFWDLASESVREQGLTAEVLASAAEEFAALRESNTAAASASGATAGLPKGVLLGAAVPEDRKIWFWQVPIVLDALGPLWSAATWDDAQLARARVAADFFRQQKGPPALAFQAGDDAGNHAQLEKLVAWFRAESAKPESYALMIVTDDDGPWIPQPAKRSACKSSRTRKLDEKRTLVVCKQDKNGEPWRLQLLDQGKEVWTRTLTQVPSDLQLKFEGDPKPLGPHGWIVPMSFGEYTAVYLDNKAEPLFYFTSW